MNIERLTVIRDYLQNPPKGFVHGFNMGGFGVAPEDSYPDLLGEPGECGAVYCISGLANVFWGSDTIDASKEILGLTEAQASTLFFGSGTRLSLSAITVDMAIEAIDTLIRTGTVVWGGREVQNEY